MNNVALPAKNRNTNPTLRLSGDPQKGDRPVRLAPSPTHRMYLTVP
jgi:hypothetical protein